MNKTCLLLFLALLLAACVTVPPPAPNFYIEGLPQSLITAMTLEERILAEEAWDYLREGRGDKAERALERLGTASPLYYVGLGYISFLYEDYQSAEEDFRLALSDTPNLSLAHLGLAQVYQRTGQENKTFNELREILKTDSQHPWAKEQYESLKAKKTEEAVSEAEQALSQGDLEKAKESYLTALHYAPESADIHLALAEIYKKENRLNNALVHLKAAVVSDPDNKSLLENYADTLAEASQYERSLETYEKLLELDGGNKKAKTQVEILKNKLGIYELPSRYNEIEISAAVTREDVAALLAVKLKDTLTDPVPQPPIIIDIGASWATRFILKVTALGLLDVYANHAFQPKRAVTRAELAESLLRIIKYLEQKGDRFHRQIPPERIQISDVTPDHFYYGPISQILSYQIMEFFPDKTFRPDQTVSGPEALKIMDVLLALIR